MSQTQNDALAANTVFYQVLIPSAVLDPNGNPTLEMRGPYVTIGEASAVAAKIPNALLLLNVVLFRTPSILPIARPANA